MQLSRRARSVHCKRCIKIPSGTQRIPRTIFLCRCCINTLYTDFSCSIFLTLSSDSCACSGAGLVNNVGHLKTMLSLITKICPAEPLERNLSVVSEGNGVQSVARPITENRVCWNFAFEFGGRTRYATAL